jgi:hypothetical protein
MSALSDYFFEQAQQALNKVDPVPPAPISPPCASGEAQDNNTESAGSPEVDWAMDTRPSHRLTDAELIAKMAWQLRALNSREQLLRAFERLVPTVYPPSNKS